jgi:uncharacterized LabA/DUF88 family protein
MALGIAVESRTMFRVPTKTTKTASLPREERVLILVDESNLVSSMRLLGRNLDWLVLRDHLLGAGRRLVEMVVYLGLPPSTPEWQIERDKKGKFAHWLRSNGFLVVTKEGWRAEEGHYKANVDVLMAIDAVELAAAMEPDAAVLVTGDADFAALALHLRRRGIRVTAASAAGTLGNGLKCAVNDVLELDALFAEFEPLKPRED